MHQSELYGIDAADRNHRNITDTDATSEDHSAKLKKYPGYESGLAVSFTADPNGENCEPIRCDGSVLCPDMYYFDRTRTGEPSKECKTEYKGNLILDLCARKEGG